MLTGVPTPSQMESSPFSIPGTSSFIKFPKMQTADDSGCFQMQLLQISKDLAEDEGDTNITSRSRQTFNGQIVGVNLLNGIEISDLI